jgi:ABC-type anion transport system duplicated permease subunit
MHLLLLLFSTLYFPASHPGITHSVQMSLRADKVLFVTVNEIGIVTVNRDTVDADHLAPYIQERLFKSYLGTGKMHDHIKLHKASETVPEMVTEVIIKEIQEGQKKALTELSLQKYRKKFDTLAKKKQDKLKKQFPVLFQSDYMVVVQNYEKDSQNSN